MQTRRHRIPTIFSIYMVDVLCCALGCVILLWQVNYYEAEEQTASARAALENLKNANLSVDSKSVEIDRLRNELDSSKKREVMVALQLRETEDERDRQRKLALVYKSDYDNAKRAQADLEALLEGERLNAKALAKKSASTAAELAQRLKLARDMAARIAALEKELDLRRSDVAAGTKKLESANAQLIDAEARNKKLDALLAQMLLQDKEGQAKLRVVDLRSKLLEQDLDRSRKDLLDTSKRFQELVLAQELLNRRFMLSSKELEEARAIAATLKTDKINLLAQARAIRQAAENRFAGITLTGNRVIFLVDMSGSMEYVEERVTDPDKWPLVCETVARVMKSLPDLREYQVILFSDKARYPMGSQGRWLEYLPKSSAADVAERLKATKPQGETNLHAAFDEAFQFRERGLDTIYVFSDGLPTAGLGLPANAANLTESQRTDVLTKHLRSRLKNVWNRPVGNEPRVRINTIGFFYESPDVGAFLWALAREHDGSFVGMSRP